MFDVPWLNLAQVILIQVAAAPRRQIILAKSDLVFSLPSARNLTPYKWPPVNAALSSRFIGKPLGRAILCCD